MKEATNKKPVKFITASGLEVANHYSKSPSTNILEEPGKFPFTRGVHPGMYRSRLWTMRQYAGFGTAKEANQRFHFLLSQGTTGLSVAFDLPTQMGRDPDHSLSKGEVGRVGVSIATVADMEELLAGLPLDKISISMTINSTAAILLGMLLVVAEKRGIPWKILNGTIQNDVLKEYIARGTYIYPPKHALKIITDIFSFCSNQVPQWNTISISGYHIREAGSTAVEELAFTFGNAVAYVEAALASGLKIDDFAPRLAFFFNCHNDFLEEIAKFRAARRIWARLLKEKFKAQDEKSMMLRFHTQTAGSSLTAQQPLNNIVRTSLQALAAVFGGTQSLHTNSYDEALGLPTEQSALIALRTQQIIAYESGVAKTVDPWAGSYLMEEWTNRIEQQVFDKLAAIERAGGMVKALEAGIPQAEIERSAYQYQIALETKEQIQVGVNEFTSNSEVEPEILKLKSEYEINQKSKIARYKSERNTALSDKALAQLKIAAQSNNVNLMPHIIECLRAQATLGEISDILRVVYGTYSTT